VGGGVQGKPGVGAEDEGPVHRGQPELADLIELTVYAERAADAAR
jgi:hypothetical protein